MLIRDMTDVQLMSLHKAIHLRIKQLEHDLKWYQRMSEREESYITKLAVAETEYKTLVSFRDKTSEELTLRDYKIKLFG